MISLASPHNHVEFHGIDIYYLISCAAVRSHNKKIRRTSRRNEVYLGDISVPDVDDMLARTLRAMIPALALAAPSSRLAALPDGLEFRAELGLNSTDVQNIASAAQKAFDITITGDELAACVTTLRCWPPGPDEPTSESRLAKGSRLSSRRSARRIPRRLAASKAG